MTALDADELPAAPVAPARDFAPAPMGWSKRALDLTLGTLLCLVAIPVVLVLALVLLVRYRANPFFVHDRIGYRARRVRMPKLRTLAPEMDPYADKKATDLKVVGGFAGFLRRSHLDELPQLFLVPLGKLSLVGPRPRMYAEAEEFDDPHFEAIRTSVPQGCTGLWQISAHGKHRVSDNPEYDLFYVEQHTLRMDLWILWRTPLQQLGGNSLGLAEMPRWPLRAPAPQVDLLAEGT